MKCPYCSSENTRVIDSRPADDNNSIRRRRLCDDCGKRFTTYEKVETIPLIIIKKITIVSSTTGQKSKKAYCLHVTSGQFRQNRSQSLWMMWKSKFLTVRKKRYQVL